jgi:hypothetical protein
MRKEGDVHNLTISVLNAPRTFVTAFRNLAYFCTLVTMRRTPSCYKINRLPTLYLYLQINQALHTTTKRLLCRASRCTVEESSIWVLSVFMAGRELLYLRGTLLMKIAYLPHLVETILAHCTTHKFPSYHSSRMSWDSVVGIATGYGLDD